MSNKKIINAFLLLISVLVVLPIFCMDIVWRSGVVATGIHAEGPLQPWYPFLSVPGTSSDEDSEGAFGLDFSQVYFSALALRNGQSAYFPVSEEFQDRRSRSPNYPPITNYLYVPLAALSYQQALLLHNWVSLLMFLGTSLFLAGRTGVYQYRWKICGVVVLLYFYTPLGYSHFERGQFDLYVATSFLLVFAVVFLEKNRWMYVLGSGFFGALKWSSLPFLGTFTALAFFVDSNNRRWVYIVPLLVVVLSLIVFLPEVREYWTSIRRYELDAHPMGVTFGYFMPTSLAKTIQILSATVILIMIFFRKKVTRELLLSISFPFATSMAVQGMCFGTISYEYRVVSFLALIPALVIWIEKAEDVRQEMKAITAAAFSVFMIVVFRVFDPIILDEASMHAILKSIFYLLSSLFFLIVCGYVIRDTITEDAAVGSDTSIQKR